MHQNKRQKHKIVASPSVGNDVFNEVFCEHVGLCVVQDEHNYRKMQNLQSANSRGRKKKRLQ